GPALAGALQSRRTWPPPRPTPASGGGRAAAAWRERPPPALPRERRRETSASWGRRGDVSGMTKRTWATRRDAARERSLPRLRGRVGVGATLRQCVTRSAPAPRARSTAGR